MNPPNTYSNLDAKITAVQDILLEMAANMVTRDDMAKINARIEEHDKVLYKGNGVPGLVSEVRQLRKEHDELKKDSEAGEFKFNWSVFGNNVAVPIIVALALTLVLKLFGL